MKTEHISYSILQIITSEKIKNSFPIWYLA